MDRNDPNILCITRTYTGQGYHLDPTLCLSKIEDINPKNSLQYSEHGSSITNMCIKKYKFQKIPAVQYYKSLIKYGSEKQSSII